MDALFASANEAGTLGIRSSGTRRPVGSARTLSDATPPAHAEDDNFFPVVMVEGALRPAAAFNDRFAVSGPGTRTTARHSLADHLPAPADNRSVIEIRRADRKTQQRPTDRFSNRAKMLTKE